MDLIKEYLDCFFGFFVSCLTGLLAALLCRVSLNNMVDTGLIFFETPELPFLLYKEICRG